MVCTQEAGLVEQHAKSHAHNIRLRQVQAYPWRRDPTRWHESQSWARQAGLVLVVPEVCARGYGARRVGDGRASESERIVGWSLLNPAVGMAEEVAKGWRIEGRGIVDHHKSRMKSEQYI